MTWEVQDIMMHQRLILELKKIVHHTQIIFHVVFGGFDDDLLWCSMMEVVEFHQKLDIGCV